MKRNNAGLTMIELLVLIAIVSLLSAILLPVAHERCWNDGRRTSFCLSNMKQIGLATMMYAQDYDETLPWNPDPGGLPASRWGPAFRGSDCAPQPSTSFVALLHPYVKNWSVFACPRDDGYDLGQHLGYRASLEKVARGSDDTSWINRIGYGFNEVLIASPCRPRTLDSLEPRPADLALFSDAERPWASTKGRWATVDGERARYWKWEPLAAARHKPSQVFVYADGHAKLVRPVVTPVDRDEKDPESGYFPAAKLE